MMQDAGEVKTIDRARLTGIIESAGLQYSFSRGDVEGELFDSLSVCMDVEFDPIGTEDSPRAARVRPIS